MTTYAEARSDWLRAQISSDLDLFDALDLPPWAQDLQNHYWEAERRWKRLDEAYQLVLLDILDRMGRDDEAS